VRHGVLLFVAAGCADYTKVETAADRAKLEEETHLTFLPHGKAEPGDAVVRIITHHGFCSGALVSPAVVVTAEHCVTEVGDDGLRTMGAGYVRVELGKDALPWGRVGANHVLVCEGWRGDASRDVAAIVLEKRVPEGTPHLRLNLGEGAVGDLGASFLSRGFGTAMTVRSMPLTGSPIWSTQRIERTGALAWYDIEDFALAMPSQHGDSGGPILAEGSDEVVGIASERRETTNATLTIAARIAPCADVLAKAAALELSVN
jgi:hypothetical protein